MTKRYSQPGHHLPFTAPSGGVVSGVPLLIGSFFVIPMVTAAAGELFEGQLDGVHGYLKAAVTITVGELAYWDDTAKVVTDVSTNNTLIGAFTAAAASGAAEAYFRLNGTTV